MCIQCDKPEVPGARDQAEQILEDYVRKDSTIDCGNLYFAATEYKKAFEQMRKENERLERELAEKQATIDKMNTTYLAWCEEKRDLDRLTKENAELRERHTTQTKEVLARNEEWERHCDQLRAEVVRLKEELKESKNAYEFLWKMRILDEMERGK